MRRLLMYASGCLTLGVLTLTTCTPTLLSGAELE